MVSDALMHRVLWGLAVGEAKYESGVEPADLAASSLGAYARPGNLDGAAACHDPPAKRLALLLMSPEFQRR